MARTRLASPARPHGFLAPLLVTLLVLAAACARPALAQTVRVWAPPGDTLVRLANSARMRFQHQSGDSTGGYNFEAYQIVGDLARDVFARMGRNNLGQARALENTLDSLGLDVEITTDPRSTGLVFMLVRNPFKLSSDGVGFLYWQRGGELRMQGTTFPSCRYVEMRAWYTARPETPYEAVLLFHRRVEKDELCMRLFRLAAGGGAWSLQQYEAPGEGPEFGVGMQAVFADVNLDGAPEIVGWQRATPDSLLEIRSGAPPLVNEFIYVERRLGFVLHDVRVVPGIMNTLNLFARLVTDRQFDRAKRLLARPATLDSVVSIGWGRRAVRGAFAVEYGEEGEQWPTWLEVKVRQDSGWRRWIFHFALSPDDRWVIDHWIPVELKKRSTELGAPADTTERSGP